MTDLSTMTPADLSARLRAAYEMSVPHHRDANAGAIALKVYEIAPTIIRLLEAVEKRDGRRFEILAWAADTFGPVAGQTNERAMRFAEEALELVHALGLPAETVTKIAERVYSRAAGDPEKEAGQAQMTLDALCAQQGIDPQDEADKEFDRVRAIPREHWKARHDAKTSLGITGDTATAAREGAR